MSDIVKFKATKGYLPRIEKVTFERETEACLYRAGRKFLKQTSYESYFDTFAEAKTSVVNAAENNRDGELLRLERAEERLSEALALKEQP